MKFFLTILAFILFSTDFFGQSALIPFGSQWKYLDNGTDQGTTWRSNSFNDNGWPAGNTQLGYGEGDEATVISFGGNTSNKYITTYFRKNVSISDPAAYTAMSMSIRRDDGVIVYINGTEVYRNNIPAGTITYSTKAITEAPDDGQTALAVAIPLSAFIAGNNTIAVEMHQSNIGSSDLSFDLSLTGTLASGTNLLPTANAGSDQSITLPINSMAFNGSGSDPDGSITGYAWTQQSGPVTAVIGSSGLASTSVSGLTVAGTYIFRLTVTDNKNATGFDDVSVFVNGAVVNPPPPVSGVLIAFGSQWKYLDNGSDQGTSWRSNSFNDNGWPAGNAQLGYGEGDEATVINYGGNASNKYITTYFRKNVSISDPAAYTAMSMSIKRDDGVIVYINGTEVYRNNISGGTITNTTTAITEAPDDGQTALVASLSMSVFIAGNNTIAVEIHQSNIGSSDISFDLSLTGTPASVVNPPPPVNGTLIAFGTQWKYLDNGSDQGTAWRSISFNDNGWPAGNAQLGYGEGDEATVISYGGNASNKYVTTYFRKNVSIADPSAFTAMSMSIRRDDGVIVYVNGTEVYRNNMPVGDINYSTLATTAATDDGQSVFTATIPTGVFIAGNNSIAVEIHQNSTSSSDLSFDMEILGVNSSSAGLLTRGPYLQMANSNSITIRWRTNIETDSKIEVGTTYGNYPLSASNSFSTTEHEVRINGLLPDTRYYYRIGNSTGFLQSGTENNFTTSPLSTTNRKIRVAVFGDCGRNDNGFQSGSLSAYQNYTQNNPGELMLLLGDNAYNSGTDDEYSANFFSAYGNNILKNHVLFPTPGNHDYADNTSRRIDKIIPYYDIFTLPKNAESGGIASGTESYYSYNWGNIHFLSLDSYGFESANNWRLYDTTSPQVQWIKNDLAANTRKWTVAYWHHPPYSMGSHNSDTEDELIKLRQNFIRILERYGVDMILCGHSHDYERSYLLKGHFGNEASFNLSQHTASSSSARYDGSNNSCPYLTTAGIVNHGTVYVVSGSSGADGGVQAGYPHNAMPFSVDDGGMFYFEVEDNRLDARFLRKDGVVADHFTIMKNVSVNENRSLIQGQSLTLTASWIGNYLWSNGASSRSITVSPTSTSTYTCRDASGCLVDQITVNVTGTEIIKSNNAIMLDEESFNIYPVPVKRGHRLHLTSAQTKPFEVIIMNSSGQILRRLKLSGNAEINTSELSPGLYIIKKVDERGSSIRKMMVSEY